MVKFCSLCGQKAVAKVILPDRTEQLMCRSCGTCVRLGSPNAHFVSRPRRSGSSKRGTDRRRVYKRQCDVVCGAQKRRRRGRQRCSGAEQICFNADDRHGRRDKEPAQQWRCQQQRRQSAALQAAIAHADRVSDRRTRKTCRAARRGTRSRAHCQSKVCRCR